MPYSNPKQPVAAFLNIKRRQGLAAAQAFGKKHRDELRKAPSRAPKGVPYKVRGGK